MKRCSSCHSESMAGAFEISPLFRESRHRKVLPVMSLLLLLYRQNILAFSVDSLPESTFRFGSQVYSKQVLPEDELLFYDWIIDAESPVALEIHVSTGDRAYNYLNSSMPLVSRSYVEIDPFPQIWLTDHRQGIPAGLEAFGDLLIYHDATGNVAIGAGCSWLSGTVRHVGR